MISFTITNKNRARCTVMMLVGLWGNQYRKSIGMSLPTKYWNATKHQARVTWEFNGTEINIAIERWREIGRQAVEYFVSTNHIPTQKEFTAKLDELIPQVESDNYGQDKIFFSYYFENIYIPRYELVRDKKTITKYAQALHKFQEFEADMQRKLQITDINIDFYNHFQHWFYKKGYSRNYFGNIIKIIKQVYRESRVSDGLHNEHGIEHRDFIAPKDSVDNVYLNTEELQQIYTLDIYAAVRKDAKKGKASEDSNINRKAEALIRARNLFLIGCYTGLRVSDFSRLRDAHIGKFITIKTQKTGTPVVIPIHPIVHEILATGFDLTHNISPQKLNGQIKELCRLSRFTEEIMINQNIGGKNVEVVRPKYELITSHTARRSFATNAYKAGVPPISIMKITGHKKESTFLKYIKVSAQENADMLSQHPFFTK